MAMQAIAAGKHVLCEKPMAASLAEARAMRDALNAAGLVGMLNFQIRFAPSFAEARRLHEAGRLGRITMIDSRMLLNPIAYLRIPDWSSSKVAWFTDAARAGGVLASSAGPHLIDFALWYGGPIVEVSARTAVMHPQVRLTEDGEPVQVTAADSFVMLARHAGGALTTIRTVPIGWQESEFTVEVHGTRGSVVAERAGGLRAAFGDDRAYAPLIPPGEDYDRTLIGRRFIAAVRAGGPSPTPNFDDGVAAQAVIEAALAAAEAGTWVAVEPEQATSRR
jgi:predicted dehydrogenase